MSCGTPRSGRGPPPWPRTSRRRRGGSAPRSSPLPPGWSDDADAGAERELAAGDRRRARRAARAAGARPRRLRLARRRRASTANSSPPRRASVSLGRVISAKRCATSRSSWSPASWPRLSLTCLNPSRSTSSTASGSRERGRPGERLVEAIAEQRAVREPGEAVVERLVGELLLEPHALGDVAGVEHDAADVPVVAQVGDVRLEVPPLAEPVAHAEDDLVRLAVRRGRAAPRRGRRGARSRTKPSPSSVRSGVADHLGDRLARRSGSRPHRRPGRGRSRT